MPERPDAVLSGINYGYNVASDIQYSATVGAALEGTFQGYRSIAFSEEACECHEVTDAFLAEVLQRLLERPCVPDQAYNVNFPGCRLSECRGILEDRKVSKGMFFRDTYNEIEKLPGGGVRLMVEGHLNINADEGTDFEAVVQRFVSIGVVRNLS